MIPEIWQVRETLQCREISKKIPRIERGRRRCLMLKFICFRDIDFDCDFEAWGETEEELFRKALEHGRIYHGMEYIPIDLQERMRKRIREENAA
jgi:predicted small metal-binding protein